MMDMKIANKYRLVKKLGSGSFGDIYMGVNTFNEEEEVAIKMESTKARCPQLRYEYNLYKILMETGESGTKATGIPAVKWWGMQDDWNLMVMELLGPSLEDLFTYCGRKFSLKTTIMLADQCIKRIQEVHDRFFIHRDIKPDNFVMGMRNMSNTVYVIDFGLSKKYRDNKTMKHIKYAEDKAFVGTVRYASINNHRGREQSRRDDLEALGYMFVYFMKGSLPWQGIKGKKVDKNTQILAKKESTPLSELCEGLPEEFATYLDICKKLGFDQTPDYLQLRMLFWRIAKREGIEFDGQFDWIQYKGDKTPQGNMPEMVDIERHGSGNGDSGSKSGSVE
ncbi:casein kinase, putative [Entamoeba histolytica HM-1:IMSS-B]|uniref:non-specific serine/threonine protein kinase n=6 Tax=Entamoeba histolytica TaxID=5759 RepID=C4LSN4_ENTH1|nr:casein kinase, putative [Entamoeba histolytica HM-1:IMSS]EMD46611.1 casein kinase, putative [Entamoeba histolytica KU27]EMH72497.1 casein kinase, putative [Entamoeba histolytica HM-1:IMSS-B]EMS17251.1 casein kinase, putative [Entamoeba histolytica HM-3:IMSS]ENY59889.1 casein kinase, putative [Entamoeba histolytica HM-1:IMSS-A]GAT91444.1 casein kinase putative [Entamoeba histolytica]|eukprot:XP_657385.1 casein kinase, putative [Entamoeba histolytica HM-1:IMSS]